MPAANETLSQFLDLVELRGRSWCYVEMGEQTGFRLPRGEQMFVYAILDGIVRITNTADQVTEAKPGEIVIILPGDAHKIRNHHGRTARPFEFPTMAPDADDLPVIRLGRGNAVNTLLCGCVEVIWPGGVYPGRAPAMLCMHAAELGIDLKKFTTGAAGPGISAILTRLAATIFVTAFRDEPRCRAQFRWNLSDPIVRAKVLIEKHPFKPWSVKSLAAEVGMGRSNFAAKFSSQTGQTPIDALIAERMKHAGILLRNTDLKIAEISERVGFISENTFFRRFTAHFGLTPSKWRHAQSPRADTENG